MRGNRPGQPAGGAAGGCRCVCGETGPSIRAAAIPAVYPACGALYLGQGLACHAPPVAFPSVRLRDVGQAGGVGGSLDQRAVHVGDDPDRLGVERFQRGDETRDVGIHAAERGPACQSAKAVFRHLRQRIEALRRCQDDGPRLVEARWPPAVVAMQAADALQQNIHRREVSHQQVGVDIQGLLQRLRPDHDHPAARRAFAQDRLHARIQQRPVLGGESAVVQCRDAVQCHDVIGSDGEAGAPGLSRTIHRIADHQHARAPQCSLGRDAGGVIPGPAVHRLHPHPFLPPIGRHRATAGRCPDGWVRRGPCILGRRQGLAQPGGARNGAEGSRHQHRMAPQRTMRGDQFLLDCRHPAVRGVNLVDNQQGPRQRRPPHRRVPDLQSGHHRLIDRAHGDLRRKVARRVFGRPAARAKTGTLAPGDAVVVPPGLEVREADALRLARQHLAGNGQHCLGRGRGKHPPHGAVDPGLQLPRRGPRRDSEIQAVHLPDLVELGKAPQRGLGLAGAGLGLEDEQRFIGRDRRDGLLGGPRTGVRGQQRPAGRAGKPTRRRIQPDPGQVLPGNRQRMGKVIRIKRCDERKHPAVRADPVRKRQQARDMMGEARRQRRRCGGGDRRKPRRECLAHDGVRCPPVVTGNIFQRLAHTVFVRCHDRRAVMRKQQGKPVLDVRPFGQVHRVAGQRLLGGQTLQPQPAAAQVVTGRHAVAGRPALGLKCRCDLADIVQEGEGCQTFDGPRIERPTGGAFGRLAESRHLQQGPEHCRYVGAVMGEVVPLAGETVDLAPGVGRETQTLAPALFARFVDAVAHA